MEDLIKRSAAIKAMEQRYQDILRIFKRKVKDGEKAIALDMIGCIKSLPSADRPRGEWIRHENPRYSYDREQGDINAGVYYTCSECDYISSTYNFCPNCGADMRGDNDV